MKRGDVIRVRAVEAMYAFYDGPADVTSVDGDRVEVFFRSCPATRWCRATGDSLTMLDRERTRFRWEPLTTPLSQPPTAPGRRAPEQGAG